MWLCWGQHDDDNDDDDYYTQQSTFSFHPAQNKEIKEAMNACRKVSRSDLL